MFVLPENRVLRLCQAAAVMERAPWYDNNNRDSDPEPSMAAALLTEFAATCGRRTTSPSPQRRSRGAAELRHDGAR